MEASRSRSAKPCISWLRRSLTQSSDHNTKHARRHLLVLLLNKTSHCTGPIAHLITMRNERQNFELSSEQIASCVCSGSRPKRVNHSNELPHAQKKSAKGQRRPDERQGRIEHGGRWWGAMA